MTLNSTKIINSFEDFVLDIKPYHSKLTEVIAEYEFFDDIPVIVTDEHRIKILTNSIWESAQLTNSPIFSTKYPLPSSFNIPSFLPTKTELGTDYSQSTYSRLNYKLFNQRYRDGFRYIKRSDLFQLEGHDFIQSKGAYSLDIEKETGSGNTYTIQSSNNQLVPGQTSIAGVRHPADPRYNDVYHYQYGELYLSMNPTAKSFDKIDIVKRSGMFNDSEINVYDVYINDTFDINNTILSGEYREFSNFTILWKENEKLDTIPTGIVCSIDTISLNVDFDSGILAKMTLDDRNTNLQNVEPFYVFRNNRFSYDLFDGNVPQKTSEVVGKLYVEIEPFAERITNWKFTKSRVEFVNATTMIFYSSVQSLENAYLQASNLYPDDPSKGIEEFDRRLFAHPIYTVQVLDGNVWKDTGKFVLTNRLFKTGNPAAYLDYSAGFVGANLDPSTNKFPNFFDSSVINTGIDLDQIKFFIVEYDDTSIKQQLGYEILFDASSLNALPRNKLEIRSSLDPSDSTVLQTEVLLDNTLHFSYAGVDIQLSYKYSPTSFNPLKIDLKSLFNNRKEKIVCPIFSVYNFKAINALAEELKVQVLTANGLSSTFSLTGSISGKIAETGFNSNFIDGGIIFSIKPGSLLSDANLTSAQPLIIEPKNMFCARAAEDTTISIIKSNPIYSKDIVYDRATDFPSITRYGYSRPKFKLAKLANLIVTSVSGRMPSQTWKVVWNSNHFDVIGSLAGKIGEYTSPEGEKHFQAYGIDAFSFTLELDAVSSYNYSTGDYFEFETFNVPAYTPTFELVNGYDLSLTGLDSSNPYTAWSTDSYSEYDEDAFNSRFILYDTHSLNLKLEYTIPSIVIILSALSNTEFSVVTYDFDEYQNAGILASATTYPNATVGLYYSNEYFSFTIQPPQQNQCIEIDGETYCDPVEFQAPFIDTDGAHIPGDMFYIEVKNPGSYLVEDPFFNSVNMPFAHIYGNSMNLQFANKFTFTAETPTTFSWTSTIEHDHSDAIDTTTKVIANKAFDNGEIHFTLYPSAKLPFTVGDYFEIEVYEQKPLYRVVGNKSGILGEARLGKWFSNFNFGFKLNKPFYSLISNQYTSNYSTSTADQYSNDLLEIDNVQIYNYDLGTATQRRINILKDKQIAILDNDHRVIIFHKLPRIDTERQIYKLTYQVPVMDPSNPSIEVIPAHFNVERVDGNGKAIYLSTSQSNQRSTDKFKENTLSQNPKSIDDISKTLSHELSDGIIDIELGWKITSLQDTILEFEECDFYDGYEITFEIVSNPLQLYHSDNGIIFNQIEPEDTLTYSEYTADRLSLHISSAITSQDELLNAIYTWDSNKETGSDLDESRQIDNQWGVGSYETHSGKKYNQVALLIQRHEDVAETGTAATLWLANDPRTKVGTVRLGNDKKPIVEFDKPGFTGDELGSSPIHYLIPQGTKIKFKIEQGGIWNTITSTKISEEILFKEKINFGVGSGNLDIVNVSITEDINLKNGAFFALKLNDSITVLLEDFNISDVMTYGGFDSTRYDREVFSIMNDEDGKFPEDGPGPYGDGIYPTIPSIDFNGDGVYSADENIKLDTNPDTMIYDNDPNDPGFDSLYDVGLKFMRQGLGIFETIDLDKPPGLPYNSDNLYPTTEFNFGGFVEEEYLDKRNIGSYVYDSFVMYYMSQTEYFDESGFDLKPLENLQAANAIVKLSEPCIPSQTPGHPLYSNPTWKDRKIAITPLIGHPVLAYQVDGSSIIVQNAIPTHKVKVTISYGSSNLNNIVSTSTPYHIVSDYTDSMTEYSIGSFERIYNFGAIDENSFIISPPGPSMFGIIVEFI